MTSRRPRDVAASVHRRLLTQAKATDRPFNELLQHYAMQRYLYRLAQSKHADRFILKGALLLRVWEAPSVRPTMDIDLLGRTSNEPESLVAIVREICRQSVEPDGLEFDPESVAGRTIVEDADYAGVRLRFGGQLGAARITMRVDVGFGDVVTPEPTQIEYPTLLDLPAAKVLACPREATVAEKFQVMLHRAQLNSRLRDYYDVWLRSRSFTFDGEFLAEAIQKTCAQRGTAIPAEPPALSAAFASDTSKQTQWRALRRKSMLDDGPELSDTVSAVAGFLGPIATALSEKRGFAGAGEPPSPWVTA